MSADIELRVRKIIADSLCVDLDSISLESSLVRDLGAESIDFLDILFRLENEFQIKIPQREIEMNARGGMEPDEFEKDMILQPKGAERLRGLLPEIPAGEIVAGMSLRDLPAKFTVAVFCSIVKRKLEQGSLGVSVVSSNATQNSDHMSAHQ